MKFAIPIIAIVLTAVAAYFTLTQAKKFESIQTERLEDKATNVRVLGTLSETEDEFEIEKERLKKAEQELLVANSSVSNVESVNNSLQNEVGDLDGKLASQTAQFAQFEEQTARLKKELAVLGDDITFDNVAEKVEEFSDSLKQKRQKIEELDTLIVGAEKSVETKVEQNKQLSQRIRTRNQQITLNSMEAEISAVNREWAFVVIGAGSNSGFSPQNALLVKRDGEFIGRVNPSAIEPNQTIAEIDIKSFAPGVSIRPGDKVILAKPIK
jgi:chromosome segregation ATPase